MGGRWLPTLLVVGSVFFAAQMLLHFPLAVARFRHSQTWGMTARDLQQWLGDYAKSLAVGAVEAAILLVCFYSLLRWFPRRWWLAATAVGAVLAPAYAMLLPIVIEPIFNDFTPLSHTSWAQLEPMVCALVDKAGVQVEDILVVDASRQTNHSNAYFTGFGSTRRISFMTRCSKSILPTKLPRSSLTSSATGASITFTRGSRWALPARCSDSLFSHGFCCGLWAAAR